jgi:glycosyltransferase involved in cell wall biosynthesis
MRIVLLVHQFLPRFSGGTEVLVMETARHLRRRGHDVHVLTAEPGHPSEGEVSKGLVSTTHEDISVHRIHQTAESPAARFRSHYDNAEVFALCSELFRGLRPDIVHGFHLYRLSTSALLAAKQSGARTLFTSTDFWSICPTSLLRRHDGSMCSGPDWAQGNCLKCLAKYLPPRLGGLIQLLPSWVLGHTAMLGSAYVAPRSNAAQVVQTLWRRRQQMRQMLQSCDAVIAPTQIMADMLIRNGCPVQSLVRLSFGLNTDFTAAHQQKTPALSLRVGYIGQIVDHKGVDVLVRAFAKLASDAGSRPMGLRIWGDLAQQPTYSSQLHALANGIDGVSFAGTFPNARVGAVLADLDVLVVPSLWYENAPLVVLSAFATRTPVIASDLPGLSELVRDGANGLLFPRGDADALTIQLRRVRDEPGLLPQLQQGIPAVKTMAQHAAELEEVYAHVLAARRQDNRLSGAAA